MRPFCDPSSYVLMIAVPFAHVTSIDHYTSSLGGLGALLPNFKKALLGLRAKQGTACGFC